jgi:hypothetical protein
VSEHVDAVTFRSPNKNTGAHWPKMGVHDEFLSIGPRPRASTNFLSTFADFWLCKVPAIGSTIGPFCVK